MRVYTPKRHTKSNCNNQKSCTVKTAAFVQGVLNVTTNSHDPNYYKFTHYGHVSNFDGSKILIKMLRDSGSLISLISSECAELCDYIDTKDTMLIKGITKEVLEVAIIQIKLSSNVMDGNIKVGIHNQMPVGFDMLYGNDLTSNNPKLTDAVEDVLDVNRSETRAQLINPILHSSQLSNRLTNL